MLSSILDSKRVEQICKPNGWRKPDQVDVQCIEDPIMSSVNEIALKLQDLERSLVNNNILHTCTIHGVTNDWYKSPGAVAIEGIF